MKNFIKKTKRVLIASLVFVCVLSAWFTGFSSDVGLMIKTPHDHDARTKYYLW